ncbi:MAG: response regulator [Bacteroidota bacterium]
MSSTVLIIDDDDVVHFMHETLLKISGIKLPVRSFLNGKQALDYLVNNCQENGKYLLLLDINMPEMNGWQLLDELQKRELHCTIKVIILTSSVDSEDHLKAKKYSRVIDFIEKPLTTEHLETLKASAQYMLLS